MVKLNGTEWGTMKLSMKDDAQLQFLTKFSTKEGLPYT